MVPTGMSFIKRHLVIIPSSYGGVQWWHRSRDKFKGGTITTTWRGSKTSDNKITSVPSLLFEKARYRYAVE